MMKTLTAALAVLLLACGGDDVAGPDNGPEHPQITSGWVFSVQCPTSTTILDVESVDGGGQSVTLTGSQVFQSSFGEPSVTPDASSRVDYIGGVEITYAEIDNDAGLTRSDTMALANGRYTGNGTEFCGYDADTEFSGGPPLMVLEDPR